MCVKLLFVVSVSVKDIVIVIMMVVVVSGVLLSGVFCVFCVIVDIIVCFGV